MPTETTRPMGLQQYSRFELTVRFCFVMFLFCGLAAAMLYKMWQIQVLEHAEHFKDANKLLGLTQKHVGTRGEIYDYDNNLLAGNVRTNDLYLTPRHIVWKNMQMLQEFSEFLAPHIGMKAEEIEKQCNEVLERRIPVTLAKNVSSDTVNRIASLNIKGVEFQYETLDIAVQEAKGVITRKNILFYPNDIDDYQLRDKNISALCAILSLDEPAIFKECNRVLHTMSPLKLVRNLSIEEANAIEAAFDEWNETRSATGKVLRRKMAKDALFFEESTKRFYPRDRTLSNLIGLPDVDNEGVTGIEFLMNEQLHEQMLIKHIILDGTVGKHRFPKTIYDASLNGANVHLTIQLPIQQLVEKHLVRLVEEHKPKRAYIVMMEPQTGAIMALAQYPSHSYVNRLPGDNASFHALVDGYEPGSIMKAVSVSSAMDFANLTPQSVIYCEDGAWRYGGARPLKEHGNIRFGDLTLMQIIQKSSNIGSAKAVIENMSEMDFYKYLRAYGMGQRTGLGFYPENGKPIVFKEEANGILHPVQRWHRPDVSRIAIGHSIVVTPFQMVQAYGAIANGGKMMQPYIIDRIVKADGQVIPSVPQQKGNPISADTARKIMECMCATVEPGGTATSAQVKGYRVCGKTGTAEKVEHDANGRAYYSHTKHTTSFLGIAPVEAPAFVLLVTADEPSGPKRYGGSVCGKTFSNIARETLQLLQIPQSTPEERDSLDTALK
ncbi:MAG: penicillin-binding protein 2 [Victivallales bacterium]|nr:penicillin-binding protein 2 [Victivallales bacterium]